MNPEIKKFFQWNYDDLKDDIFYKSEVQGNKVVGISMFNAALLFLVLIILYLTKALVIPQASYFVSLIESFVELMVPAIICFVLKGRGRWIKWIMLIFMVFVVARVDGLLSYRFVLFSCLPLILSARYYSRRFTAIILAITIVALFLGTLYTSYFGFLNLNYIKLDPGTYTITIVDNLENAFRELLNPNGAELLKTNLLNSYLPRMLVFVIIGNVCISSANKGRNMVLEQANIVAKNTEISYELNVASAIQSKMLPNIFPPFPEHKEFDLYAFNGAAKEVGGDFYDFFLKDPNHLWLVISDVSGKGVPAALVMVITKTVMKNLALEGNTPAQVLEKMNRSIMEGNETNFFVTSWIGEIDLEKNTLTYSVAGHNPPLLKRVNSEYNYLKGNQGLVLGVVEDMKYEDQIIPFNKGDKLFLYTDGVTEAATLDKKLYGEKRLRDFLNNNKVDSSKETIDLIRQDILEFSNGADQTDDITMVLFKLNEFYEKTFDAKQDEISNFLEYLGTKLQNKFDEKFVNQILIIAEELFVNISNYAYKDSSGIVKVNILITDNNITIDFIDNGIEFNPLKKEDPNLEDRLDGKIGGLGIYMVKQIADEVNYKRENNQNIFTIKKSK